ncbi:hypothetical protein LBMAG53_13750 [Planctomycetota bacterium]|nr:hypothetical protein LBMAG53_13750 [Planctomycetota bacterium]
MADSALSNAACGPYVLRELISVGATAEVYRASHRDDSNRSYAVKVIKAERLAETALTAGLREEFGLLQRLDHASLPRAWRLGGVSGRPALVMGYFAGRTVAHLMAKRELAAPTAVLLGLVEAVSYLHKRQVVHNDLKPENVVIAPEGRLGLVDFGSARDDAHTTFIQRMLRRRPSTIFATPTYAAPEVLAGERPKIVSDVFSLAVLAHLLLVGSPPWSPNSRPATPPSLRQRMPKIDPAIAKAIDRCLSTDPAMRLPDGEHLLAALRSLRT